MVVCPPPQVLYQSKTLSTALFSVLILGKRYLAVQWFSFLLLSAGVILVEQEVARPSPPFRPLRASVARPSPPFRPPLPSCLMVPDHPCGLPLVPPPSSRPASVRDPRCRFRVPWQDSKGAHVATTPGASPLLGSSFKP